MNMSASKELWRPSLEFIQNSNLFDFQVWLKDCKNIEFDNYHDLWQWSIDNPAIFWESIWNYFDIIDHGNYSEVMSDHPMPETIWFEGSKLNYAEHIFRSKTNEFPAILVASELNEVKEVSWTELEWQVAKFADFLKSRGVGKGDRVAAFLPNILEASIALLATLSIGAVWSSCSPDFGTSSVVDRFKQIKPKVLLGVDGYTYNGKPYEKKKVFEEIVESIPGVETIVFISFIKTICQTFKESNWFTWEDALDNPATNISFEAVDFNHPIWVLYSSGTTGVPKAITHSHGGVLLEHYKYLAFHNDVHPGEVFFWYSTTGWMMWNYVHASLLMGATILLYEGSPAYPDLKAMWTLAESAKIAHFGTSAPFLVACMKAGLDISNQFNLSSLRSIGSTGSPLPPEAFDYVYEKIDAKVWLCSMSGGSDVCTAFVGGCPLLPVFEGEIQCRALGCSMYSFDAKGNILIDEVGEMVVTKPMPSMPVYFWNDKDKRKYHSSYFEHYPNVWRHGDWLKVTPRNSLVIMGRSDATLNRQGVRIGTSEIYRAMNTLTEIKDSLVVNLELAGGNHYMPLFVIMNEGFEMTKELERKIKKTLRVSYSPRHVPDEIIIVNDIPYTISGKKMEAPVKKILLKMPLESSVNLDSMRNPESIKIYLDFAKTL
jgi:acetoacetyl-CoA synthetase